MSSAIDSLCFKKSNLIYFHHPRCVRVYGRAVDAIFSNELSKGLRAALQGHQMTLFPISWMKSEIEPRRFVTWYLFSSFFLWTICSVKWSGQNSGKSIYVQIILNPLSRLISFRYYAILWGIDKQMMNALDFQKSVLKEIYPLFVESLMYLQ